MTMTATEKNQWEMQAYGNTKAAILSSVKNSITFKFSGPGMVIASYLSDAQEIIGAEINESNEGWVSPNQANQARQYMNIAKMLMMEFKLGFSQE